MSCGRVQGAKKHAHTLSTPLALTLKFLDIDLMAVAPSSSLSSVEALRRPATENTQLATARQSVWLLALQMHSSIAELA